MRTDHTRTGEARGTRTDETAWGVGAGGGTCCSGPAVVGIAGTLVGIGAGSPHAGVSRQTEAFEATRNVSTSITKENTSTVVGSRSALADLGACDAVPYVTRLASTGETSRGVGTDCSTYSTVGSTESHSFI